MAKGLGRGIGAFFPDIDIKENEHVQEIKISDLRPNPYQPRKTFTDQGIEELKNSIIEHGILQPIIARKSIKGFEIVAGERRFRAAKEANLETVPVIIRKLTDQEMMEQALLENLQREDLNVVEEARAYQTLMKKLGLTQEKLSKRVGKSRSHIANQVRLLDLPTRVLEGLMEDRITMGHGRALLGLKKKEQIELLYNKILSDNLTVRQVEQYIQNINENVPRETKSKNAQKSVFIKNQESILREKFGTLVRIQETKKKGKIEIEFYSNDDLNRLLQLLYTNENE